MPEYQFDVLCMSDDACHKVMSDMESKYPDKVQRVTDMKNDSGDHFVKLNCKDINDADRKGQEMMQKYSNFIRTITVTPL